MGDCSNGIEVEIKNECGAVTTKNFEQTELQFERGPVCTAFECTPLSMELLGCKRYALVIGGDSQYQPIAPPGVAASSVICAVVLVLECVLRDAPTISTSDVSHFSLYNGAAFFPATNIAIDQISDRILSLAITVTSGLVQSTT
jgi:hypothetical protein